MSIVEDIELDHEVPFDLLELYEVLEWEGRIEIPQPALEAGSLRLLDGNVITRSACGLAPPRSRSLNISRTPGNTIHYEGPRMGTFPHSSCASKVRGIQRFHMDVRKWSDIAYTSVVCPHGYIFEGRWWGVRTAANGTDAGNNQSYAHCALIGENDVVTNELKIGLSQVCRLSRQHGKATDKLWRHLDWKPTACPGPLSAWVKEGMPLDESRPPAPPQPNPPQENDMFSTHDAKKLTDIYQAVTIPDLGANRDVALRWAVQQLIAFEVANEKRWTALFQALNVNDPVNMKSIRAALNLDQADVED